MNELRWYLRERPHNSVPIIPYKKYKKGPGPFFLYNLHTNPPLPPMNSLIL